MFSLGPPSLPPSLPCSCKSGGDGGASSPLVGRVRALSIMLFSVVLAVMGQYWWYQVFDGFDAWQDGWVKCSEVE